MLGAIWLEGDKTGIQLRISNSNSYASHSYLVLSKFIGWSFKFPKVLSFLRILDSLFVFFFLKKDIYFTFFFLKGIPLFLFFIYLFIFGCVGSSFLCEGFL